MPPDVVDFDADAFFEVLPASDIVVSFRDMAMIELLIFPAMNRPVILPRMRSGRTLNAKYVGQKIQTLKNKLRHSLEPLIYGALDGNDVPELHEYTPLWRIDQHPLESEI
jgi:hypothetical protein